MRPERFKKEDRAVLDALLKQYDFLRVEITQSINLEHAAIIGLYTSLGLIIAVLIAQPHFLGVFDAEKTFLLFALIIVQIIVNSFGSLFLKEQARNRRACSFLIAIEDLINEKIGGIGVYWEHYITSRLIAREIESTEYLNFDIPINPQYYKNRLLGVGIPVFLPNVLITFAIVFILCPSYMGRILFFLVFVATILLWLFHKKNKLNSLISATDDILKSCKWRNLIFLICGIVILYVMSLIFFEESTLVLSAFYIISFLITFFWALMIIYQSGFPLKKENVPSRKEVLEWLRREQKRYNYSGLFEMI